MLRVRYASPPIPLEDRGVVIRHDHLGSEHSVNFQIINFKDRVDDAFTVNGWVSREGHIYPGPDAVPQEAPGIQENGPDIRYTVISAEWRFEYLIDRRVQSPFIIWRWRVKSLPESDIHIDQQKIF